MLRGRGAAAGTTNGGGRPATGLASLGSLVGVTGGGGLLTRYRTLSQSSVQDDARARAGSDGWSTPSEEDRPEEGDAREDEQLRSEVRQILARLSTTLPFVLLFALKYIYQRAIGLSLFFAYSFILIQLNQRFKAQVALKNDQSRGVLVMVVAVSVLCAVVACVMKYLLHGTGPHTLLIPSPKPGPGAEEVLWAILASDVTVRLLFAALKAGVALLPGIPLFLLTRISGPAGSAGAKMYRMIEYVWRRGGRSATGGAGDGQGEGHVGHGALHTATSVHTRKRRLFCFLEGLSQLTRSVLPISGWCCYYQVDTQYGSVFVFVYLSLKCMVLTRQCKALFGTLHSLLYNSLEYGRPATIEEVQEAGSVDCPICYEKLENPVITPCSHVFCEDCVSEWLEREKTCPVCRAEVAANADWGPDYTSSRDGSTSAWPCVL